MSIDTLVSRRDFTGAFKAVKPHVLPKPKASFDALRNVEVRFFEDHLTLTATNRYTLGQARVDYLGENRVPGETGQTAVLVDVDDLAYAVKRPNTITHLSVQLKENAIVLDYTSEAPLCTEYEFPKTEHLWPKPESAADVSSIMLNAQYLAYFDTRNLARDRSEKLTGLELTFYGEKRPVGVTFGDYFRGLIMPVRRPS